MDKTKLFQWLKTEGLSPNKNEKQSLNMSHSITNNKIISPDEKGRGEIKKGTGLPPLPKKTFSHSKNYSHNPPIPYKNQNSHGNFGTQNKINTTHSIHKNPLPRASGDIRVVPLGGMEQVGLNMMFIEWGNEIILIDAGNLFPSPEHLGVDILIPNISYLIQKKQNIRGIILTHGHLDHIGGLPYMLKELGFPTVYASKLTKELALAVCEEHLDTKKIKFVEITPKTRIHLGKFDCEFFHVNHSIPENLGVCVHSPYGAIIHSSDFKIDHNPSDKNPADLSTLSRLGHKGVALAMVDSTNVMKSGHTVSEFVIQDSLEKLVHDTKGRLIVTTFASNIGRIARLVEAAEKNGRTVFLSGRSMEKNLLIARKLGYLRCKDKTIHPMSAKANTLPPSQVMILSTGSQGEELAALTRMAAGIHKEIKLRPEDTIAFSSSPIPGNELAVVSVLNNLAEIGCKVVDKEDLDIYVSGHGHREELKLFTTLVNPRYFAPIHGELFMRKEHQDLVVKELGFKKENTFIMKNGQGIVLNEKGARLMTEKEAIPAGLIMIELKEKLGEHVLADRTEMSKEGAIFISISHSSGKPTKIQIRARGFIYMGTNHEIFSLLEREIKSSFETNYSPEKSIRAIEEAIVKLVKRILLQKFKKNPIVEVIIN